MNKDSKWYNQDTKLPDLYCENCGDMFQLKRYDGKLCSKCLGPFTEAMEKKLEPYSKEKRIEDQVMRSKYTKKKKR